MTLAPLAPSLPAPSLPAPAPAHRRPGRTSGPRTPPDRHPTAPPVAPPVPSRVPQPRVRRAAYEPGRGSARGRAAPASAAAVPVLPHHPDAPEAIGRLLRLAGEVLDGRRPAGHLAPHAEPAVLRCWRVTTAVRRRRSAVRFGPLRLSHPRAGVAEVAVAVELDGGVRALAARFDLARDGWRWTAVRLG